MESPGSRLAGDPETPKAVYTTAGTLYNPKSTQPMQPPNRRGRTKWTLPGTPSSELSLLPKSALSALPLRGLMRSDTSPLPEYSPLQQNTDRAVSPSRRKHRDMAQDPPVVSGASLAEMTPRSLARPLVVNGSVGQMPSLTAVVPVPAHDDADAAQGQASSDSEFDGEPLRGFPVKSLHNLASYPNPNQKRAQKALLGARPPSSGANRPLHGASLYLPDDQAKIRSKSPALLRYDPDDVYRQNPEPKPADNFLSYNTDISRHHAADVFTYDHPPSSHAFSSGYKTTLARGPGAPKPLTAGPPGQRQHKAAFDPTFRALQNKSRSQVSVTDEDYPIVGYDGLSVDPRPYQRVRPLSSEDVTPSPSARDSQNSESSTLLEELRHNSIPEPKIRLRPRAVFSGVHGQDFVHDAKLPSEVRKYYPEGLPMMNVVAEADPGWLDKDHAVERGDWNPGTWVKKTKEMERQNVRSFERFYTSYVEMADDMDHVIKEAERRQHQRLLGIIGDRRPKHVYAPPPTVNVEEAIRQPTAVATHPILKLLFATLIRHIEATDSHSEFRQYEKARPELIDPTPEGKQSFFGGQKERESSVRR